MASPDSTEPDDDGYYRTADDVWRGVSNVPGQPDDEWDPALDVGTRLRAIIDVYRELPPEAYDHVRGSEHDSWSLPTDDISLDSAFGDGHLVMDEGLEDDPRGALVAARGHVYRVISGDGAEDGKGPEVDVADDEAWRAWLDRRNTLLAL